MRILHLFQISFAVLAACGSGYYLLCIWSAHAYQRLQRRPPGFLGSQQPSTPPVSILKPLRGSDPHIYECFRSHCLQDYPEYEIIFGVDDPQDPVISDVERLQREFPHIAMQLVVCSQRLGPNTKVSNLIQMERVARHPHMLVNDSDIHVPKDYLRRVMEQFCQPKVGLVTSLYRGIAGQTLGSRLEALGISTEFMGGVLVARQIEGGLHFALGSTLAVSRQALADIGGFDGMLEYLADDFELGYRVARAGYEVALADLVVETYLPDYTFGTFLEHQLRWGRSTRDSRRWGYVGLIFTFGFTWSILAVILSRGAAWAWALLGTALFLRLASALVVGPGVVHDSQVVRDLWLVPLRELISLAVWTASFFGHTVTWRGKKFMVRNKRLVPLDSPSDSGI
ncbi:MAG: bacteriohopanetetrol glucosamine biosynthesis glycosyltransferase HpnI [Chlamydiota bacterium]